MEHYRERVLPGAWVYLAGALLVPALLLIFLPLNPIVGVVVAPVGYAGYVLVVISASPTIEVTDTQLRVGSARVPILFCGRAYAYSTRERARAAAGRDLDARAWLCLRGWVATSVRVDIVDPRDPIPYWLFSTRHPAEVVAALERARAKLRQP